MARLARFRERINEALWLAPAIGLIGALALAALTLEIDDSVQIGDSLLIGFGGGPDSARSILSTIAASMLTFLGLVFTLTMVTLQLASDYSPRVLRNFLLARPSKVALGAFVTTLAYSILVLRSVSNGETAPELSVTVATALVLVSVIVFVYYLSAIAQSLRVANIVEQAGDQAREEIDRAFGPPGSAGEEENERRSGWAAIGERRPDRTIAWPHRPGVVTAVDLSGFRELACELDATIELCFEVGDFLPKDAPAIRLYGTQEEIEPSQIHRLIATSQERTVRQDAAFGLRQLVDIASRGLSPGVNDPTTAVQAIDQLHDLLGRIGSRRLHSGVIAGSDGRARVLIPVHSWRNFVRLACDEIRIYGEGSLQVARRLRAMLTDLDRRLPECRREEIGRQLQLLDVSVERSIADADDRELARTPGRSAAGGEG